MTRRVGRLVVALVVAVVMATLAFAQVGGGARDGGGAAPPPPGGGARRPGGGVAGSRMEMADQLLDRMNLSAPEKASVKAAVKEKLDGQRELRDGLTKLDAVVRGAGASDREVQRAVDGYVALRDRIARRSAERDADLMKRLSPRAQAQLLTAGVIDNGLLRGGLGGGRGPTAREGGGMMRRGEGAPGGGRRGGSNVPEPR